MQRLVYIDDLFVTLSKVTGPHLILDVLVPHPRVDDSFTLHAAGDLVQDVPLARILSQIVSKFVLQDFKEHDLFLLHVALNVFIVSECVYVWLCV